MITGRNVEIPEGEAAINVIQITKIRAVI